MDVPFSPWLKSLKFTSPAIGYAVGWAGKIMKTADGGDTWTDKPASGNAASRDYNGTFFLNNNTGFAVGGNPSNDSIQTIIKTTDGGDTWNIQRDNLGYWLNAVYFIDNNIGFVVGDKGTLLKTTDGGNNWTPITLSGNIANRDYRDVYFKDADNGWIVGGNKANDSICTILKTTDGGVNWSIISDNLQNQANAIAFSSANTAWVALDNGKVLQSTDGGNSFTDLALSDTLTEDMDFYAAHFFNGQLGVIAGEYGRVLVYENNIPDFPEAVTLDATNITDTSARLNADVNGHGETTTIEFEYGTTTALGSIIVATPATVSSNAVEHVYANLTALASGIYYYRAKASNWTGTAYGDIKQFYVGTNPIPNFDFELWETDTISYLSDWKFVGKIEKTPSYDNSSAARILVDSRSMDGDGEVGGVFYGNPDDGFSSGVPFTDRPDSLIAYFNYSLDPGTEAFILSIFFNHGNIIAFDTFAITGNSGGQFQRFAFPITFQTADFPDSLAIAIGNNNPFNETIPKSENNILEVDNISFSGTSQNVPNANFENWEAPAEVHFLKSWIHSNHWVSRTSDAQHGNYAVILENKANDGSYFKGVSSITNGEHHPPAFAVYGKHQTFNGYYKFLPQGNDSLRFNVQMFKNGNDIGGASYMVTEEAAGYIPITIPLHYNNPNEIPDSALIYIQLYGNPGSKAYIDNLSFDGFNTPDTTTVIDTTTVSISETDKDFQVEVYPNPANTVLNIAYFSNQIGATKITIAGISGETIYETTVANVSGAVKQAIPIENLAPGLYFIKIENSEYATKRKIIVVH